MDETQYNSTFRLTEKKLIEGVFLRRLNRFVVECSINGKKHFAHLPNPGRLWELLFKNSKILLYENNTLNRSFKFTVAAVYKDKNPILLHTTENNSVAEWLLKNRLIEELRDFEIVSREKQLNESRIDFHLSNGKEELFLEVKSCTLFKDKIAMFPDAITERGSKHLLELSNILNTNVYGGVLFLVHNYDVEYFLPEFHTDLKFAQTFLQLKDKLKISAYALNWRSDLSLISNEIKKLKVPFHILEKEANDSGSYIIVLYNNQNQLIKIGNLGELEFKKGYYCYVGSAVQHLKKRVERHKRKLKKLHWHIDYLLTKTKIHKTLEIRSSDKIECELANELKIISDGFVKNFGSSDCKCSSHLFYFHDDPIQRKDFIDLILHFRIARLIQKYNL
ncbi:MAG: DNA/RNA nuclease SfsA [Ignavibacteria bacterium]|nr:DNA/RNA nuclease SfsA [Ignavibacteria bacterium]